MSSKTNRSYASTVALIARGFRSVPRRIPAVTPPSHGPSSTIAPVPSSPVAQWRSTHAASHGEQMSTRASGSVNHLRGNQRTSGRPPSASSQRNLRIRDRIP